MKKKGLYIVLAAALAVIVGVVLLVTGQSSERQDDGQGGGKTVEDMVGSGGLQPLTLDGVTYTPRKNIASYLLMGVDHDGEVAHYTNYFGGQADTLLLVVVDKAQQSYAILQLNRDTMCMVDFVDTDGKPLNQQQQMQLALSHSMGTGMEDSCENTVRAVSALLYGVTIDGYAAFNMDSMSLINDAVGGVTVLVEDDFSAVTDQLPMGQEVTLHGDLALTFVQSRGDMGGEKTNINRMSRQAAYLRGLYTRLQSAAQDEGFLTQLLLELSSYLTTDCTANQLNDLYRTVSQDRLEVLDPPTGETAVGDEGYMEFHVDEAALRQTVIDLFYEPRQAS